MDFMFKQFNLIKSHACNPAKVWEFSPNNSCAIIRKAINEKLET
jgi:hypothetical protein